MLSTNDLRCANLSKHNWVYKAGWESGEIILNPTKSTAEYYSQFMIDPRLKEIRKKLKLYASVATCLTVISAECN